MLYLSDEIIKQQIVAQLNEYVLTQQQVCDYLRMDSSYLSKLINQKKLEPFHILENGKMNVNLFYQSDVDKYKINKFSIKCLTFSPTVCIVRVRYE